ncbi:DUF5683 domain-containing protein [Flavobacterium sp.]|uniref:DUF5683 domain-containing protein n=1 Tax=Flavobacterium sp. TaxID=239 RepID=UPI00261544B8|nr:DUF5683 domain-containing protein [Flavobacterium sp.]MDD3004428.1 DUF5683 domain-containing protein [Flavobacterium sp.]
MKQLTFIILFVFSFGNPLVYSQNKTNELQIVTDTILRKPINPLAPARAAFYSAIVPGLGQAYNKKYWKIPLVYGALGTGYYFYNSNNKEYHRYRNAYKQRMKGLDDEFKGQYSDATLINAQRTFQRNRDLSLIITMGLYVLNIVDANVDAHLQQFNVDDNLTIRPEIYPNDINNIQNIGLTLTYRF